MDQAVDGIAYAPWTAILVLWSWEKEEDILHLRGLTCCFERIAYGLRSLLAGAHAPGFALLPSFSRRKARGVGACLARGSATGM